ncbi:MAG: gliding motility-associated C-terminal domain-containing protein [bacterium]|nr:gliding motility-associated C-terminal domain-containing protein [bacterium]
MRIKFKIIILFALIFLVSSGLNAGTLLLDDFNSSSGLNKFGGANNAWSGGGASNPTTGYYVNPSVIFGGTGCSMKISYNVTTLDSYCGFTFLLNGHNISQYNYLSFWVRGAIGGEFFKVELKNNSADPNREAGKSYITDYYENGVTTDWKKVVIPLDAFTGMDSYTNMNELVIVFENYQSRTNNSPLTGTIYFDDIVFGTWFSGCVKVDHFNDNIGNHSLGGNIGDFDQVGTMADGGASHSFTNSTSYSDVSPYTFVSKYWLGSDLWVGNSFIFGGGNNGWTNVTHDFSRYDNFVAYVRARSTKENPGTIQVEMTDNVEGDDRYYIQGVTTNWKKYSMPFINFRDNYGWSAVNDLNRTNLKKMCFTYKPNYTEAGIGLITSKTGVVLIDNIRFEKTGYAPDISAPVIPSALKCGNNTVTNNYIFGATNRLSINADTDSTDPTIEGVFFEYSLDNGATWYLIDRDYDTADSAYSVIWDTSGIKNNSLVRIRVYAMDATGNKSGYVMFDAKIGNVVNPADLLFKKPDQKILTPNDDGVNDTLNFTGLVSGFEINIYDLKGLLIKKITEDKFWDGKDKDNKVMENGIYIYQVKNNGQKIEGTVLIVK